MKKDLISTLLTHPEKELMEINIVYINIDMITQRKCFETSWEWHPSRLFSTSHKTGCYVHVRKNTSNKQYNLILRDCITKVPYTQ